MNIPHLNLFETYKHGPIQQEEALFLYSFVKMIRPKTIIEFGYQTGLSALNFLKAMDDDCFLYSFDIDPKCLKHKIENKNFKFLLKGQETFQAKDIDNKKIDICFLDGAHNVKLNMICFEKILKHFNPGGFLIIHDTGTWTIDGFKNAPTEYLKNHTNLINSFKIKKEKPAVKAEKETVELISKNYPNLQLINLHTTKVMRNGFTIFQIPNSPKIKLF